MNDYSKYKLSELAELTVGFVGTMTNEYVEDGIPFLRSKNIAPFSINYDDLKFISDRFHKKIKKSTLHTGDVVIVRTGKPGTACVIPPKLNNSNCSDLVIVRPGPKLDSHYFSYFMNSLGGNHVSAHLVGAVQQHFNVKSAKDMLLNLPPLPEQKAIAHILGTLDDKIELNRQMNQTLEAMAQALFKSWFVNFDPVMDNALAAGAEIPADLQAMAEKRRVIASGAKPTSPAGRQSVSKRLLDTNPELAAKFPSSFVFNETLGKWIPEGWGVKSLDKIANYQNGLALQKFRPQSDEDDSLPVLKISHLKDGKTDGKEKVRTDIKSEYIVEDGDMIFSWSASLFVDIWCGGKAALNQHLFKVTSKKFPKWFYYLFTKHHLDEFIRIAADKAVTMGHIKREHLSEAKCAIMSTSLMNEISAHFENLIDKQIDNRLEIKTLTQLRDRLLPELISGRVRVKEEMIYNN